MADNKKRKFFNILDIVIILLVAVAGFVLYKVGFFGSSGGGTSSENIKTVSYVVQMTPMRFGTEQNIKIGDELLETVKRTPIGTVKDVEITDAVSYSVDYETGNYVASNIDGEKTAYITVETQCDVTDESISAIDGQLIRCGDTININGPGYFGFGTVVSIERGDGV